MVVEFFIGLKHITLNINALRALNLKSFQNELILLQDATQIIMELRLSCWLEMWEKQR